MMFALFFLSEAVIALGVVVYLQHKRIQAMALNFASLQTAAAAVSSSADTLTTQAAASDDASNQAAIDGVAATLTEASAKLTALIVPPAEPAV